MSEAEETKRPFPTHWDAANAAASGAWAQKRRLATAMRLVMERLVRSDAPEEELSQAADGARASPDEPPCRSRLGVDLEVRRGGVVQR